MEFGRAVKYTGLTLYGTCALGGMGVLVDAALKRNDYHPAHYAEAPQIPRCFDTPQPAVHPPDFPKLSVPALPGPHAPAQAFERWLQQDKSVEAKFKLAINAYDQATDPKDLVLPVDERGLPKDDPVRPPGSLVSRTAPAVVELSTQDWKGSGFVLEGPAGTHTQRVITAAHVIGTATLNQITITADDGRRFKATSGCYMFEQAGKFRRIYQTLSKADDQHSTSPDIDIAVLNVSSEITEQPLRLSVKQPAPGTWTSMVNYQGFNGPKNSAYPDDVETGPAAVSGLVTPKPSYELRDTVITGLLLSPNKVTNGFYTRTHLVPGGSGGPALNESGEVIGLSTAGSGSNADGASHLEILGRDDLAFYNLRMPGARYADGQAEGLAPTVAFIVPARIIRLALRSKRLG